MADGLVRALSAPLTPTLSRPQAGEGWGEGIIRTILTLFIALFSVAVTAEELPDPTRPPAMIAAPDAAQGQGAAENRWSSGLQTIIISASRRVAIIDGQTVELGAKHGNARLVEVNEGSVMLQGAQGRQVLTLFPDVKISRKGSPNKESQVKQPSSASKVQSGRHKAKPVAREEKK